MHLGKWTRRLLIVFVAWYILRQPGDAGENVRWAGQTALHYIEVGFVKAAEFLNGVLR